MLSYCVPRFAPRLVGGQSYGRQYLLPEALDTEKEEEKEPDGGQSLVTNGNSNQVVCKSRDAGEDVSGTR